MSKSGITFVHDLDKPLIGAAVDQPVLLTIGYLAGSIFLASTPLGWVSALGLIFLGLCDVTATTKEEAKKLPAPREALKIEAGKEEEPHSGVETDCLGNPINAAAKVAAISSFPPATPPVSQNLNNYSREEVLQLFADPLLLKETFGEKCPDWVQQVVSKRCDQLASVLADEPEQVPEPVPAPARVPALTHENPTHDEPRVLGVQVQEFSQGSGDSSDEKVQEFRRHLEETKMDLPANTSVKGPAFWFVWKAKSLGIPQKDVYPVFGVTKGASEGYQKFKEIWDNA